jgi:hypothetical protein
MRILRILTGFALACLAAAATLVLFVYAPGEWTHLRSDLDGERLSEAGFFTLVIVPHVMLSAVLPALAAATFAETRRITGWMFYVLAGLGTAMTGFVLQLLTEAPYPESIFHAYALIAFLTAGVIGGLVYWASSGRFVARPAAATAAKPSAPG